MGPTKPLLNNFRWTIGNCGVRRLETAVGGTIYMSAIDGLVLGLFKCLTILA